LPILACHHGDFEPQTLEAVLVTAADALSAARPGARRETLESYIKRLRQLEEIADSFDGVEKSYAIHAGREVRIIVKPDRVGDDEAYTLARNIARRIQDEVQYPGQRVGLGVGDAVRLDDAERESTRLNARHGRTSQGLACLTS